MYGSNIKKKRIDVLLVEMGFFSSREKARAAVMAGEVSINGQLADKPGMQVYPDRERITKENIKVKEKTLYISRGGYKLARALEVFPINLQGRKVLDIGASTGGFTDCALKNGADYVYAVDVGYGQMAWSLRSDNRVKVLERTNIRYLEREVFTFGLPEIVTIDVSFISLGLVLPRVDYLLEHCTGVALIKPQFEAGREAVGKKGVVKDPVVHRAVLQKIVQVAETIGISVLGIDYSPIKGPEGNIEYLLHFKKPGSSSDIPYVTVENIKQTVSEAHRILS